MFKSKSKKFILGILLCICAALFACGIFAFYHLNDNKNAVNAHAATAITPTIYWGYFENTKELIISNNISDVAGASNKGSFSGDNEGASVPWSRSAIQSVKIMGEVAPKSMNRWFSSAIELLSVDTGGLDTSFVIDMTMTFYNCKKLQSIDVSNWNTSRVTNMDMTFCNCSALTSLDVSGWNTSNLTCMESTFEQCIALSNLDVSGWNTSNVTSMAATFYNCNALNSINVSGWNTSKVTNTTAMFSGCNLLEKLDLRSFEAGSVISSNNMLSGLTNLKKIRVSETLAKKISLGNSNLSFPLYYKDGTLCSSASSMEKAGGYFKTKHTHDYVFTSKQDATCTEAGEKVSTCSEEFCEEIKKETLPATGLHDYVAGDVIDPTCTAQGYTNYTCSVCGHKKKDDYQPVTAHAYEDVTTDPTCTAKGYTTYTCSDCNDSYVGDEVDSLGHDWNAWHTTKEATEDEAGEEQRECQRAGCSEVEKQPIPKLDHVHVEAIDAAKEPTCTETGLTEGKHCSVCNYVIVAQTVVPATGHTPGAAADCTTAQTCTVCGTELAAALGHNYEAAEGGVAPTCTTAGSGKIVCSRCNDEKSGDTIPALGHDWASEWCKDETNHWHECNRCDEVNDETAHTYDWVITKDPTEDETGLKENLCTVCGHKDGEEVLAKLVTDDNGSVGDLPELPPDQDYDLEIAVKESDSLYNIEGITKGYKVELFVVDGENRTEYDNSKKVTLMLVIPEGMEDNFTLYCRYGDILEPVDPASYTINGRSVTIRTTLPNEYVFNAPAPEEPSAGIPWWVWLIVGLVAAALLGIFIIIIVVAKKKKNDDNTPTDNGEVIQRLDNQDQILNELLGRDDGGFNTPVELDENGNVIFK